jgi:CO dehydrogenase maturation factor
VSGKGGVGKTTLSAMLAAGLGLKGRTVIALDADPDANLAAALGLPPAEAPTPLAEMKDLIEQRTAARGGYGGYFRLNPKVDDLPDEYAARIGHIRLLALGGVKTGGGGCICPASALAKALLSHLVLGRDDAVIMDMEAGIEHLGRATGESMDGLVVVVDQGPWSVQTALRIRALAADIGLARVYAVANRVPAEAAERIRPKLEGMPLIGCLPYDERLASGVVARAEDGVVRAGEGLSARLAVIERICAAVEGCSQAGPPQPARRAPATGSAAGPQAD